MSTRERHIGSVDLAQFAARSIVTADLDVTLVRQRFYSPDGSQLLAELGCTPSAARKYAALLLAGAQTLEPLP